MEDKKDNFDKKSASNEKNLQKIIELIETIQYGSINLTIQDGYIIQIEKNEKIRMK